MMPPKVLIFGWLFLVAIPLLAQKKSHEDRHPEVRVLDSLYRLAKDLYEEGKIDQTLQHLEVCLHKDNKFYFNELYKGTRADIYKLLAFTYISLDRIDDAIKPIKKMLSLNPFYQPLQEDLLRFRLSLDTLKARSGLSLGIRGGMNYTSTHIIGEQFSVINGIDVQNLGSERYQSMFSNFVGLFLQMRINRNLAVVLSPSLSNHRFSYEENYELSRLIGFSRTLYSWQFWYNFTQDVSYYQFPLMVKYNFKIRKSNIHPYLQAGGYFSWLNADGVQKQSAASFYTGSQKAPNSANFALSTYGWVGSIGFSYELKTFAFGLDLRYNYGLKNITKEEERYHYSNTTLGFYDIPNDLTIRSIELGFTIRYHFSYNVYR